MEPPETQPDSDGVEIGGWDRTESDPDDHGDEKSPTLKASSGESDTLHLARGSFA
jgi:hypothetical protein